MKVEEAQEYFIYIYF